MEKRAREAFVLLSARGSARFYSGACSAGYVTQCHPLPFQHPRIIMRFPSPLWLADYDAEIHEG